MSFSGFAHRATPRLVGGGRFKVFLLKDEYLKLGQSFVSWWQEKRNGGRGRGGFEGSGLLFLLLRGQQEEAGGAWLLPGKADLQLETTNPWWQWPAWFSKATDKISNDLGQQTVEETEKQRPDAHSLMCWTEGFLFCSGNCTLACLLKKKMTSALMYIPPGDQISQQDRSFVLFHFFPQISLLRETNFHDRAWNTRDIFRRWIFQLLVWNYVNLRVKEIFWYWKLAKMLFNRGLQFN